MNGKEIIYDIKRILTGSNIIDDSRLSNSHLLTKFNEKRATEIRNRYKETGIIDSICFQSFTKKEATKINSGDDPNVSLSSICLGKITIPMFVDLAEGLGAYRIMSSSKQSVIYPIDQAYLFHMIGMNDERLDYNIHYFNHINSIYVYPYTKYISGVIIYDDPTDAKKLNTEKVQSGDLEYGTSYTIYSGTITYNTSIYNPGDTITPTSLGGKNYTGPGYLMHTNKEVNFSLDDEYPVGIAMAEKCIIRVVTEDFNIEKKQVTDLINDAADQLKIISSNLTKKENS